jgi:CheY-like chemotaxis protein
MGDQTKPPQGNGSASAPLILIIDDHPDIRTICTNIFNKAGYRTATASSGKEALAWLDELTPGLIVLDLMMPELDGFTTARLIRSRPATAQTPIVVLTAASADRDRAAFAVGAQAFCTKPVDRFRLLECVQRLCPMT